MNVTPEPRNPDRLANGCIIALLIVVAFVVIGPAIGWFIATLLQFLFAGR